MKRTLRLVLLFLFFTLTACPEEKEPTTLLAISEQARQRVEYQAPSAAESAQLQALATLIHEEITQAQVNSSLSKITPLLEGLNLKWQALSDMPSTYCLLEKADHKRGWGAYCFRIGASKKVILQSPHGFYDMGTQEIGASLFKAGSAQAFFFNTTHRHQNGKKSASDIAHNDHHPFTEMGRPFHTHRLIQLHGFKASGTRQGHGVILSHGANAPPCPALQSLGARLTSILGPTSLYYKDILELGGTKNSQGRLHNSHAHGQFIHLEMSREIRDRLRHEKGLILPLAKALEGGLP